MLNLELDILDTVKYSGSMLCVEQLKGSENSLFLFFYKKYLTSTRKCGKIVSPRATGAAGVSIIPHCRTFVKGNFAQRFIVADPEILCNLPIVFFCKCGIIIIEVKEREMI